MTRAGDPDGDGGAAADGGVRIPRLRHPVRIVVFLVVLAALLAGAFVAGRFVTSPTDEALRGARATVPVTATVDRRVVSPGYALPAALTGGTTFDVTVTEASVQESSTAAPTSGDKAPTTGAAAAGSSAADPSAASSGAEGSTERVVVTSASVAVGDVVGTGRLLAEVSGRPLFALPTSVPLYRDLLPGMSGNDVKALQQTLIDLGYRGVTASGAFDGGSVRALGRLYADAGYRLPYVAPGVQGLAVHEFAGVPTASATVLAAAGVGTTLSSDVAVVRLQTSAPVLTAQITAVERDVVTTGTTVTVSSPTSGPIPTTVLSVGDFVAGDGTTSSGYPITLAVPEGLGADAGTPLQVTPATQAEAGPAIPLVALRQEGTRTFVVLAASDDAASGDAAPDDADQRGSPAPPVEVDVTVLAQADGWASIAETERLPIGQRLAVES